MLLRTSILVLVVVIVKESFAEDRPREYREGAYCKDVSYVDTATEGVEGKWFFPSARRSLHLFISRT